MELKKHYDIAPGLSSETLKQPIVTSFCGLKLEVQYYCFSNVYTSCLRLIFFILCKNQRKKQFSVLAGESPGKIEQCSLNCNLSNCDCNDIIVFFFCGFVLNASSTKRFWTDACFPGFCSRDCFVGLHCEVIVAY